MNRQVFIHTEDAAIHPDDAIMVEMIEDETNHPLNAILVDLRAEYDRSLRLHPPEEWMGMELCQMRWAIRREVFEMRVAEERGDMGGPHGMIEEAKHIFMTALRAYMELKRRVE